MDTSQQQEQPTKIDLSGKTLYEINISKYFKYYNSEYLDLFYLIARQVFIILSIDFMNYLAGNQKTIFTQSRLLKTCYIIIGCMIYYLLFFKFVKFV